MQRHKLLQQRLSVAAKGIPWTRGTSAGLQTVSLTIAGFCCSVHCSCQTAAAMRCYCMTKHINAVAVAGGISRHFLLPGWLSNAGLTPGLQPYLANIWQTNNSSLQGVYHSSPAVPQRLTLEIQSVQRRLQVLAGPCATRLTDMAVHNWHSSRHMRQLLM